LRVDTGELLQRSPSGVLEDGGESDDGDDVSDEDVADAPSRSADAADDGFADRYLATHLAVAPRSNGAAFYDIRGNALVDAKGVSSDWILEGPLRWSPVP
jgi:hypothetical protein